MRKGGLVVVFVSTQSSLMIICLTTDRRIADAFSLTAERKGKAT